MQLRKYCVTVMDNWTPTRLFWTRRAAVRHWRKHGPSHLFIWQDNQWKDLSYPDTKERLRRYPVARS